LRELKLLERSLAPVFLTKRREQMRIKIVDLCER
jgi:hypothetical protein